MEKEIDEIRYPVMHSDKMRAAGMGHGKPGWYWWDEDGDHPVAGPFATKAEAEEDRALYFADKAETERDRLEAMREDKWERRND